MHTTIHPFLRLVEQEVSRARRKHPSLHLRLEVQQRLDTLIEYGQTVLDDVWFWSVMQEEAGRHRSRSVPQVWIVEGDATDARQDNGAEQE